MRRAQVVCYVGEHVAAVVAAVAVLASVALIIPLLLLRRAEP
jgi:hypothetical protein